MNNPDLSFLDQVREQIRTYPSTFTIYKIMDDTGIRKKTVQNSVITLVENKEVEQCGRVENGKTKFAVVYKVLKLKPPIEVRKREDGRSKRRFVKKELPWNKVWPDLEVKVHIIPDEFKMIHYSDWG